MSYIGLELSRQLAEPQLPEFSLSIRATGRRQSNLQQQQQRHRCPRLALSSDHCTPGLRYHAPAWTPRRSRAASNSQSQHIDGLTWADCSRLANRQDPLSSAGLHSARSTYWPRIVGRALTVDSALVNWRRHYNDAATELVGSPSSSSSACSSDSSTSYSAPFACSSLADDSQHRLPACQPCIQRDLLKRPQVIDPGPCGRVCTEASLESCDDDDELALLDHQLLSLAENHLASLTDRSAGPLPQTSCNIKQATMREPAVFQCSELSRRNHHINQPNQARPRPAHQHLSAPVRVGELGRQCLQHTPHWSLVTDQANSHLLYNTGSHTEDIHNMNQESICSCSSSLDCLETQHQFFVHQDAAHQQRTSQHQSMLRAHQRVQQLASTLQNCASLAQSARQAIASGAGATGEPQETSRNDQSKQFHRSSEASALPLLPPPPPPPPQPSQAQAQLGQASQNAAQSQPQVAALVHQSTYTTSAADHIDDTQTNNPCLLPIEQSCDFTRVVGANNYRPSAQLKHRQAVSFRRSATTGENQSCSAFVYSSNKSANKTLAKQRSANVVSPPKVRSNQPERHQSRQRSPRHTKTPAGQVYGHGCQQLASVQGPVIRPSSAVELGRLDEQDSYNTNSLQTRHYPSLHLAHPPMVESLAAPVTPISLPAVISHRTNSPWMRISSIILTPIGIVIILFIVVSPLLHYLM